MKRLQELNFFMKRYLDSLKGASYWQTFIDECNSKVSSLNSSPHTEIFEKFYEAYGVPNDNTFFGFNIYITLIINNINADVDH